ncbi:MAG: extracellular solute-binding protein [Anaerolineae bacterium]
MTFWHNFLYENQDAMDAIIEAFNEENPYGVMVVGRFMGGTDDIDAAYRSALGGGEVPDIILSYSCADLYLLDGATDIEPLLRSPTWGIERDAYYAGLLNTDVSEFLGGVRLGFPAGRSAEVMMVNLDWLAELWETNLITFDGPPQTTDQFREMACAAAQQPFSGAISAQEPLGYQVNTNASTFAAWVFAFGGTIFDGEQFTFDAPEAIEAATFLRDLVRDGCAGPVLSRFGDQDRFGAGTTLATTGTSFGGQFYERAVRNGAAHTWAQFPLPHITGNPVLNVYGPSLTVTAPTPEREVAAWLFIRYLGEPAQQAQWSAASGYYPVHKAAEGELNAVTELLDSGLSEPAVPGYNDIRLLISTSVESIIAGADPQETLMRLTISANALLDTYR